jgi:hypothetical protein
MDLMRLAPMYFGPGTSYKACTDHAMYQALLESISSQHSALSANIRVDVKGNSKHVQAIVS